MPTSRREFLQIAATTLLLPDGARAAVAPAALPAVIATWDFGLTACTRAYELLRGGADLLDALEKGVNLVEDDPKITSVGFGGLPNDEGVVQLDAAIMDGRTHKAGAVAAIERIRNPISVARRVMEKSRHVLLAGDGARRFAVAQGFVEQDLLTPESRAKWEAWKQAQRRNLGPTTPTTAPSAAPVSRPHDTVCVLALDAAGHLATAVSTSGLAWKLPGRVGDSPILGAGSYVDDDVGAAAATGVGELTLRTLASFAIVERMRAGSDPMRACREVMNRVIAKTPEVRRDESLGLCFIALDKRGRHGALSLRDRFPYALAGAAPPSLREADRVL